MSDLYQVANTDHGRDTGASMDQLLLTAFLEKISLQRTQGKHESQGKFLSQVQGEFSELPYG
jgi:hypothetical protein